MGTFGTVLNTFKAGSLRSESLGNALSAKVQSLAQAGGAKVFPRPILVRYGRLLVRASSELRCS